MAEDQDVRIVSWPEEGAANLSHRFEEESPARVIVRTEDGFDVDMAMRISAKEAVPLCIKLCEPICVRSEYTIGIEIFDRPFASITVRGQTNFANCRDDQVPSTRG
jgi:hypothetical protein